MISLVLVALVLVALCNFLLGLQLLGRGTLEVWAAPELCLLTGITEEDLLWTAETSLLLGTLSEGPEERIISELLYRRYQLLFYLPSGQHPNLPA